MIATASGAAGETAIQLGNGLLHHSDTVTVFTLVGDFFKPSIVVTAILQHLGIDHMLGAAVTVRTHLIPFVFNRF